MHDTTIPDAAAARGGRLLAALGLAVLVLGAGQLVAAPGVLAVLIGFVAAVVLPVLVAYGAGRAALGLPGAVAWARSRAPPMSSGGPERFGAEDPE